MKMCMYYYSLLHLQYCAGEDSTGQSSEEKHLTTTGLVHLIKNPDPSSIIRE